MFDETIDGHLVSGHIDGTGSLDERIDGYDREIAALAGQDPLCQQLMTIPGVGPLTATAIDEGGAGSRVKVGVPTSARIPGGAFVERIVDTPFDKSDHVVLNLREADFTTANAIVQAVNGQFGAGVAKAIDAVSVAIRAPQDLSARVAFVSMVENMERSRNVTKMKPVVSSICSRSVLPTVAMNAS